MISERLELKFERAEQYSIELEKSYTLQDSWKQRGDELLYSMIPRPIADRLRLGESRLNTCQVKTKRRFFPVLSLEFFRHSSQFLYYFVN